MENRYFVFADKRGNKIIPRQPYFDSHVNIMKNKEYVSAENLKPILSKAQYNKVNSARPGTFVQICSRLSLGSPPYGLVRITEEYLNKLNGKEHLENELIQIGNELNKTELYIQYKRLQTLLTNTNKELERME